MLDVNCLLGTGSYIMTLPVRTEKINYQILIPTCPIKTDQIKRLEVENFFIFGLKLKTDFLTLIRIKNELFVITRFSSFCTWQLVSIILFCYDLRQLDGPGIKNKIHPPTPFFSKIWMTKIRLVKMSGLIWIQTIWQTDHIPERFFWKKYLKKKKKNPQTTKKHAKWPSMPRVKLLVTTAADQNPPTYSIFF